MLKRLGKRFTSESRLKGEINRMQFFIRFLEEKFLPVAGKLSANRYLMSLRDGLVLSMPLMIVGSVFIIIAELPIPAYQTFMAATFGAGWSWWNWGAIWPATAGLVTLFAVFGIAYTLSKTYGKEPLPAGALAVSAYFILLHQTADGGFSAGDLGAQGLFAGMILAVVVAEIYNFIIEKKIVITMPENVPPSIARSFTALVPAAVIIPLFVIIRFIFMQTDYVTVNNFIFTVLQTPLTGIGTSLPGTLISVMFVQMFWSVGIHGASIVGSVMGPIWQAAALENLAMYQAGSGTYRVVTQQFIDIFIYVGGSGATLSLAFIMAFLSKSKQIKYLGRLSLGPGLFNINETITFGLPIVMNPMLIIPFFIAPLLAATVTFFAMSTGLVTPPVGIAVPWTTPVLFGGYLSTGGDFKAVLLQVVNFVLTGLVYFPFISTWDKKKFAEESEG